MSELLLPWQILPIFFLVAFMYAMVGHGGASGYLALFALLGFAQPQVAPIALSLNIVVSTTGFVNYYRGRHFSLQLLLPFVVASIPGAFIGGWIPISSQLFSFLLGIALFLASLRIFILRDIREKPLKEGDRTIWMLGLPIGFVLGFFSGLLGIGGGIFLSPVILLLRWADAKKTAAVSSAFILLNSISGLFGHIARGNFYWETALTLAGVVFMGGFLGSYLGSRQMKVAGVQTALGFVLIIASIKLVLKYFNLS